MECFLMILLALTGMLFSHVLLMILFATALMRHMICQLETRFSSHNCFVKWNGKGYGESLGLYCDQQGCPLPWGRRDLNAKCNWCLTDYSLEKGALAVVPGSHHRGCLPLLPQAIKEASPIECPRGSLVAFHGDCGLR